MSAFRESNCPAHRPRVAHHRLSRDLSPPGISRSNEEQQRLDEFLDIFTYEGNSTARRRPCQVKCPVGITASHQIDSRA